MTLIKAFRARAGSWLAGCNSAAAAADAVVIINRCADCGPFGRREGAHSANRPDATGSRWAKNMARGLWPDRAPWDAIDGLGLGVRVMAPGESSWGLRRILRRVECYGGRL